MATAAAPIHRSPLHHWHADHGARLTENNGWQFPAVCSGVEQEVAAAQTVVAIADFSAFAKLSLQGAGVAGLVEAICPNSAAVKPHGVAILSDQEPLLGCRLTNGHLLLLASTANDAAIRHRIPHEPDGIVQNEVTSTYAEFLLIGPRIEELLRRLSGFDLSVSSFPVGSCAETSCAGTHAILVRFPELTVPTMRILVAWDLAEYVWETMFHAGRQLGIVALGMNALGALRGTTRPG